MNDNCDECPVDCPADCLNRASCELCGRRVHDADTWPGHDAFCICLDCAEDFESSEELADEQAEEKDRYGRTGS